MEKDTRAKDILKIFRRLKTLSKKRDALTIAFDGRREKVVKVFEVNVTVAELVIPALLEFTVVKKTSVGTILGGKEFL